MSDALDNRGWWTYLNRYHWYVFALASLGWLFDTMDGQIYVISRSVALRELMAGSTEADQGLYGGYVTTLFVLGWATGGLIFGIIGDRWGRAKTMALTIFIYAIFTGLSGLSQTWWQFGIFRFLTGLGVGGEFASGTAMIAEAMPEKARSKALGMLQGLSAVGNIIGALLFGLINPNPALGWRWLYAVGAFPALLAIFVRLGLKESDKWLEAKAAAHNTGEEFGKIGDLFRIPKWRRNTLVGLGIAIPGIIGVWGISFYSPELLDKTFRKVTPALHDDIAAIVEKDASEQTLAIEALPADRKAAYANFISEVVYPADKKEATVNVSKIVLNDSQKVKVRGKLANSLSPADHDKLKTWAIVIQQIGAFFGMFGFCLVAHKIGRKWTFLLAFLLAWVSVIIVFSQLQRVDQVWYMWPLLGAGTLCPLGGFAVYFPELFPTRLRTTGIGICYNVGRYVSAFGATAMLALAKSLTGKYETEGFRLAAMIVASVYFIGMLVLLWAPETVNKPLPED